MYAGVGYSAVGAVSTSRTANVWASVFNGSSSSLYANNSQTANATGNAGTDSVATPPFNIGSDLSLIHI